MKLIKSDASLINESNPLKLVELIGRTCYKSEDKITDDSCYKFVDNLASRKHYAMLEHANLLFEIRGIPGMYSDIISIPYVRYTSKYFETTKETVQYLSVSLSHIARWRDKDVLLSLNSYQIFRGMDYCFQDKYINEESKSTGKCAVTLSDDRKVYIKLLDSVEDIINVDDEDRDKHQFYTVKFICDRGVSHEFARHRCAVAQESTRYCRYGQGKFGSDIEFIEPANYDNWSSQAQNTFIYSCQNAEDCYKHMTENYGMTPQEARAVLNNALKTEIILTMPRWQWKHFFDLRYFGTTGQPHPDAKLVSGIAYTKMHDMNII